MSLEQDNLDNENLEFQNEDLSKTRLVGGISFLLFFLIVLIYFIVTQPSFFDQNPYRAYLGFAILAGWIGSYLVIKVWKRT